mgnify:CR=1 FL=1
MMNTPKYFLQNVEKYPNEPAISIKDEEGNWQTDSWKEFYDDVLSVAKALLACGVEPDDKISIYSYNRKEWNICYAAAQFINAVAVGVYHTCSSNEVEWVVGNSDSKVVFVGNNPGDNDEIEKMPNHRLMSCIKNLDKVEKVVVMDGVEKIEHQKCIGWDEYIELGTDIKEQTIKEKIDGLNLDDTSSLIYTSGTTGNPKGVELTYRNWTFLLDGLLTFLKFDQSERIISWLPGAHVFGQALDNHYWARRALHMHIVDHPLNTVDYAKEIQPHLFCSVPRIYEKVFDNLRSAINSKAILKYGLKIPILSGLLKNKLRKAAGFGELRFAISGAAPINPDILTMFHELGIPLYEGYGMTENTAGATLNFTGNNKIGSVGKALPETNIKIADDGEILLMGDHVMKGYYNNTKATNDTIIDGWLHTGDVGKLDDEGFLTITGRKKEIYVNSAGKNIAPLVIEETMKSISLVSQCFLVGDNRNYCTGLITLDMGVILRDKLGVNVNEIPKDPLSQMKMLTQNGKKLSNYTDSEIIKNEIEDAINKLNEKFSNPEQIKKISILPRDFTIDDGELTPTLKIRRKQINDNWSEVINSMYEK